MPNGEWRMANGECRMAKSWRSSLTEPPPLPFGTRRSAGVTQRLGCVTFAEFTFDPASGELTRGGLRVPLQPQPSRLLNLLLARAGEVVTREEIRAALWADGTHVDFERSLNFCVARLRAALAEDAAAPQYVETVPTRGYRFIAATQYANATKTRSTRITATRRRTGVPLSGGPCRIPCIPWLWR
jgi:DNA-binding winged helix-turn-helix (wHTH) protein